MYIIHAMLLYCMINVCSTSIIIITSPQTYMLNSFVTLLLFMIVPGKYLQWIIQYFHLLCSWLL